MRLLCPAGLQLVIQVDGHTLLVIAVQVWQEVSLLPTLPPFPPLLCFDFSKNLLHKLHFHLSLKIGKGLKANIKQATYFAPRRKCLSDFTTETWGC